MADYRIGGPVMINTEQQNSVVYGQMIGQISPQSWGIELVDRTETRTPATYIRTENRNPYYCNIYTCRPKPVRIYMHGTFVLLIRMYVQRTETRTVHTATHIHAENIIQFIGSIFYVFTPVRSRLFMRFTPRHARCYPHVICDRYYEEHDAAKVVYAA